MICDFLFIMSQGLCEQAMAVFKKMEADGIETNIVMLNSVLNSFSVAAKPEEGLAVFEYMHQNVRSLLNSHIKIYGEEF